MKPNNQKAMGDDLHKMEGALRDAGGIPMVMSLDRLMDIDTEAGRRAALTRLIAKLKEA